MMIKVKENNDDASKAFGESYPKHKGAMIKIISKYDEVFQEPTGLPPKICTQHEI